MNLEQIDTSTTAGKAEVMRLAAEGRRVAQRYLGESRYAEIFEPKWDWVLMDYAIIAEPVGPDEVWLALLPDGKIKGVCETEEDAEYFSAHSVCYIRADLAGEKGAESREERLARYRHIIAGEKG